MQRQLRWALVIVALTGISTARTGAHAFALLQGYASPGSLPEAVRWVDGFGLEDGIQVGVEAGFEAALGIDTPEDVALVRAAIVESLRTWENPALRFDITFDATVERGADSGYEIDILAVPGDDPVFGGAIWFGLADLANTYVTSGRTLSNGTVAEGWVATGGDVFINSTLVVQMSLLLSDDQERLDALQRLTTHEVGHILGLHHPNYGGFDTDLDPFNAIPIDPTDPYADLFFQFNYDPTAVMAAQPCGGGLLLCPNLFVKNLQPDDIGGLAALYPVIPACDDGVDNDGDGRIDFDPVTFGSPGDQFTPPAGSGDPGCFDPSGSTESPECQDGIDNNADGTTDYDGALSALGYLADDPDPYCIGKPWQDRESEPTPTPTPTATPTATPTSLPTPTHSSTASPTPSPAVAPTATPTPAPMATPTPTSPPGVELTKDQQACVNEMNKNGAKINRAQLRENATCLKRYQQGKLTTTFEVCATDDRDNKMQKIDDKTVQGEAEKCDSLPVAPPFAFTGSTTVYQAGVEGAMALTYAIFGGPPVLDADLATKSGDKDAARCQLGMLKRASELENTVLKQINRAKKRAIGLESVNASALETALTGSLATNDRITRAEQKLVKGVEKKCALLQNPAAAFPGDCADPDLGVVEGCVIAAARCQACLKIEAFDDLHLDCDELDDGAANMSCP